jgi:hypothetical protein
MSYEILDAGITADYLYDHGYVSAAGYDNDNFLVGAVNDRLPEEVREKFWQIAVSEPTKDFIKSASGHFAPSVSAIENLYHFGAFGRSVSEEYDPIMPSWEEISLDDLRWAQWTGLGPDGILRGIASPNHGDRRVLDFTDSSGAIDFDTMEFFGYTRDKYPDGKVINDVEPPRHDEEDRRYICNNAIIVHHGVGDTSTILDILTDPNRRTPEGTLNRVS